MVAAFGSLAIELSQLGVITRARAGMPPARMATTSKSLPKLIHLKPSLAMMRIPGFSLSHLDSISVFKCSSLLSVPWKCNSKGLGALLGDGQGRVLPHNKFRSCPTGNHLIVSSQSLARMAAL